MSNILLVNPSQYKVYRGLIAPEHPPIGLGYIGGILEHSRDRVSIIDIDADNITPDILKKKINENRIEIVGITASTPTFENALEIAKTVKENSSAKVILGGMHPTLAPAECIRSPYVDFVVLGEGEETIGELVASIEDGEDPGAIRGIAYKRNGQIYVNGRRPLIGDLDSLPFPAMHLFNNRRYTYADALYTPAFPIVTSRGCPGRCTYCNTQNIFSHRFRARSARNVVDEIEGLVKRYSAREIHIWDDNFATLKRRVFEIRDEIIRRGIDVRFAFPNGIRADFLDREVLKTMKEMGTYSIAIGVESGDPKILSRIKKKIRLDSVKEVVAAAKNLGIETWAFFMIGLPGEDSQSIKRTIRFAVELEPDIAKFHILKPFPGTEVYDELLKNGLIQDRDLSNYGIHTPPVHCLPTLTAEDIARFQRIAYRRFYLRPKKIIKQITRLRTYNRMKLNTKMAFSILKKMLKG